MLKGRKCQIPLFILKWTIKLQCKNIVVLVLKCRICHFIKWQIRPFDTKGGGVLRCVAGPLSVAAHGRAWAMDDSGFTDCNLTVNTQPSSYHPVNKRRCHNAGLMLAHRRRRWANIKTESGQRLVFAGQSYLNVLYLLSADIAIICQRGRIYRSFDGTVRLVRRNFNITNWTNLLKYDTCILFRVIFALIFRA